MLLEKIEMFQCQIIGSRCVEIKKLTDFSKLQLRRPLKRTCIETPQSCNILPPNEYDSLTIRNNDICQCNGTQCLIIHSSTNPQVDCRNIISLLNSTARIQQIAVNQIYPIFTSHIPHVQVFNSINENYYFKYEFEIHLEFFYLSSQKNSFLKNFKVFHLFRNNQNLHIHQYQLMYQCLQDQFKRQFEDWFKNFYYYNAQLLLYYHNYLSINPLYSINNIRSNQKQILDIL